MTEQSRQFTLLLIDDNPTNLTLLAKIIELDLPQVRVLTASTGKEGLRLAEREQVDGAFVDVQMPEMSGLEVCRRLKAEPRTATMPLVLITAHLASPEMRAEGLEVGAYDFISQPISNVEMLARIKVMLRLCEGERDRRDSSGESSLQTEESSAQLRWVNGLLLSAGRLNDAEQRLLQELANELNAQDLDEPLLTTLLTDRFPLPWRRTFLKLAMLDSMPPSLMVKLSELKEIEAVFDYLQRHDMLLAATPSETESFSFKPEVRQQLRAKVGQLFDPAEQQQLWQLAADWFQQRKKPLAAFACLQRGGQYQAISQLLSQSGLALLADQYQPQLMELLAQIPEEEAVGCGWMSLYKGVGFMRSQPLEVDTWLELARNRFVAGGDKRGELLALSQQLVQYLIADGQVEQGMPRLVRLRELVKQQVDFYDTFSRLKVLFAQALGELFYAGELSACEELLSRLMSEALREQQFELQMDISLLQVMLGIFQGRYRVARSAMEQARGAAGRVSENCHAVQIFRVVACELLHACGELDSFAQQRHSVRQFWGAEQFQQSSFAPLLNFFSCLSDVARGNNSAAEELLEVTLAENPAALRPHLQSWLLQLRGLLHAQAGRRGAALADSEKALELRQKADIELHRLPNLLLAGATALLLKDYGPAKDYLQAGLSLSLGLQEERYRGGIYAWLAALYRETDHQELALEQVHKLCDLLRRQRTGFFFALSPELLSRLVPLAALKAAGPEILEQVVPRWLNCRVAEQGRLVPLADLQTFGAYKFCLNDNCCDLSEVGQSSRLLLALLAVSPNNSMSSELLMSTLWPDSPPSKARNSFDTALSRLRRALESYFGKQIREDYLQLEKGMLLLRNLRIDRNEFLSEMARANRHLKRQNLWQAELALWNAERIWQGEFLTGFELDAELPYRQDELNQLRLEQLTGLAELLRRRGDYSEAVRLLQLGLQLEPTHDGLIQQLLDLYYQLGDQRAARQLLEGYRGVLEKEDYDVEEIDELITALSRQWLEL